MKALSIRQPWAWLIVNGYKPVENRTWNTHFRGQFLIHASKAYDFDGLNWVRDNREQLGVPEDFADGMPDFGGIIGMATLTDCVTSCDSPWFFGPRGFLLRDAMPLPFRALPGKLGFFEVTP